MVLINISEAIERREIAMDGIPMWAQGGFWGFLGGAPKPSTSRGILRV